MEISNIDISTLLNMIDTFYNNAWNKLVLFGGLIIVIVGIVLPAILQWASQRIQQGKNIEMENKLRKELTNSINLKGKSIEEKNKKFIDNYFYEKEKVIKNMSIKLSSRISFSIGLNYHNLGVQSAGEEDFFYAIRYYIIAGHNYVDAKNEGELKIILGNIESCCLHKIKDSFEFEEIKKSLDNFISKLKEEYPDERYSQEIRRIEKNFFTCNQQLKNKN